MPNLNKEQREILETAVDSQMSSGIQKPITVFTRYRGKDMTGYSKSFVRYINNMWKLIDAGLIAEKKGDSFAYLTDLVKIDEVLTSGKF